MLYVGCKTNAPWEVFKSESEPTMESHGSQYNAVIGPFRTKAGAEFMRDYGKDNPHCATVDDAEWLGNHVEIISC